MCHIYQKHFWGIWWFHRSKYFEAMKAGRLAIQPISSPNLNSCSIKIYLPLLFNDFDCTANTTAVLTSNAVMKDQNHFSLLSEWALSSPHIQVSNLRLGIKAQVQLWLLDKNGPERVFFTLYLMQIVAKNWKC